MTTAKMHPGGSQAVIVVVSQAIVFMLNNLTTTLKWKWPF